MKVDKRQLYFIRSLSKKYNLTEKEILEIIESPFIFIREEIKKVDLSKIKTEEDFIEQTKNFNIPSIGKLYANIYNFKKYKKNESKRKSGENSKG